MNRKNTIETFWTKVDVRGPDDCWEWLGSKDTHGYGKYRLNGKQQGCHRIAFEHLVGQIPTGRHLDHVRARGCTSRACVNPRHLEAVTPRENLMRGDNQVARNAGKTHCIHGHEFTPENTRTRRRGWRVCLACLANRNMTRLGSVTS